MGRDDEVGGAFEPWEQTRYSLQGLYTGRGMAADVTEILLITVCHEGLTIHVQSTPDIQHFLLYCNLEEAVPLRLQYQNSLITSY